MQHRQARLITRLPHNLWQRWQNPVWNPLLKEAKKKCVKKITFLRTHEEQSKGSEIKRQRIIMLAVTCKSGFFWRLLYSRSGKLFLAVWKGMRLWRRNYGYMLIVVIRSDGLSERMSGNSITLSFIRVNMQILLTRSAPFPQSIHVWVVLFRDMNCFSRHRWPGAHSHRSQDE